PNSVRSCRDDFAVAGSLCWFLERNVREAMLRGNPPSWTRSHGMTIRTGIGGWTYPPWRGGTFYPEGLPQKRELEYASRAVGAIEINATFYRLQTPASFRQWRAVAPEGFVFTLKGSRFVTNRKVLGEGGEALAKFLDQGLVELGNKLGPIC